MTLDSVAELNTLEAKGNVSEITGLSKVNGRIYDNQAERDTRFSKYHEQIFRDQLLSNTRLLQYYHRLRSRDEKACSWQKLALKALYKIYSSNLRPAHLSTALESSLQLELLEIINQPYGIQSNGDYYSGARKIVSSNSPLWELHDWSLRLTGILIDSGILSGEVVKDIKNDLANLIVTIRTCQLKGESCPHISRSVALIAHCLNKSLQVNLTEDKTGGRLFTPSFICDYLFPLACESAAKEYPATMTDPISHYSLFGASGKLKEPQDGLAIWPETWSESSHDAAEDKDADPLPPAHVCLEYLIFKLMLCEMKDRDVVVKSMERIILGPSDNNSDCNKNSCMTTTDNEACKIDTINKIVALTVLGHVKLFLGTSSSFLNGLVLPSIQQDCLLMKICKFQLLRCMLNDKIHVAPTELLDKSLRVYFSEFMKILDIENLQEGRHKLFVVFVGVAASFLHNSKGTRRLKLQFDLHSASLKKRRSQLSLVKRIIALYVHCKIIQPLDFIDLLLCKNEADKSFTSECERHLTKAIDSIATELLVLLPKKSYNSRVALLMHHLFRATELRRQMLPGETVIKMLDVAKMCILDVDVGCLNFSPINWKIWSRTSLRCATKWLLEKPTQASAIDLLDRLLDRLTTGRFLIEASKLSTATMILGNLCFYQAVSWSNSAIKNETGAAIKSDECDNRNLLFESFQRIEKIFIICEMIKGQETDSTSSCIMSALMGWPKLPSANNELDRMWRSFVELGRLRLDEFRAEEIAGLNSRRASLKSWQDISDEEMELFETYDNLLFAMMAAFNREPRQLDLHLNRVKGPASNNEPHIRRYVKLWLDVITRTDNVLWLRYINRENSEARFYVLISFQTLISIRQAHTDSKLAFSIKELMIQLNLARRAVLKWLTIFNEQAVYSDSPLKDFYASSIRQLEAIENFK